MRYNFEKYLKERAAVTDDQLHQIKQKIERRSISRGEILLAEGEVCEQFFYVEQGLLRFYSIDKKGNEHILEFAPEKWFVSDRASAYFNEPSEYFIDTVEPSQVVVLSEKFINFASEVSQQFRRYNERILQNHIRHLQNRITQLVRASAEDRYLQVVEKYPDLITRVPQWMVASFLGITPESLSRIRKELAGK